MRAGLFLHMMHVGGGHRQAGKLNATIILFTILANNGNYCQLHCPEDQAEEIRTLFLKKIHDFGFEHDVEGNFIYVGSGRIEIAIPRKLRGTAKERG